MSLQYVERPAAGQADGLLVLHHGRGSSERDLLGLADALDGERRLHVVAPRGPLMLAGSPGYHWYMVPRVGYPDPATFHQALAALAKLHDELWARTAVPAERTVLGGFSMGAVMSYALGLSADRPAPAGIMAYSGFIPIVEGWMPALLDRVDTRVFIAHGRRDPVMNVDFARDAREQLSNAGLVVDYRESDGGHQIDPGDVAAGISWLDAALPVGPARAS